MKHLFIINPAAGAYDHTAEFTAAIETAFHGTDFEIAVSRGPGDCTRIAREAARTGQDIRLYACGGDGTLNEVVNGAAGYDNASVTVYCGGSGNDFVRQFSDPTAFSDLSRLRDCDEMNIDLIQCGDRYALNICSIGLDARVGTAVSKYKRLPLVTGSGAYLISTLVEVVRGISEHYVITFDDERIDANQTLICIANGRWYGGGFHPTPEAQLDDGLLDVLIVKPVSRLKVAQVIGKYKKGRHTELPELTVWRRCKKVTVRCDKVSPVNLDGELWLQQEVTFEAAPHKIRFAFPHGLRCNS